MWPVLVTEHSGSNPPLVSSMLSQVTAYSMMMMKLKAQDYDLMASSLGFVPGSDSPGCAPLRQWLRWGM